MFDDVLCAVNPQFYHRFYGSAPANLKMFYNPLDDGTWDAMAHWEGAPLWTDMGNPTEINGVPFILLKFPIGITTPDPAFALAVRQPQLSWARSTLNPKFHHYPWSLFGPSTFGHCLGPSFDLSCDDCLTQQLPLLQQHFTLLQ